MIGPLLIVVGLVLLGWIPLNLNFGPAKPGATEGLADRGLPGAFLVGVLFGARAGATLVGGLQRSQGAPQTANGWLIVAIAIYLTLAGTLGLI